MAQNETKPAGSYAAVTPSDSAVLRPPARSLFIGTGGNVAVKYPGASAAVSFAVQDGTILPIYAEVVMSTGTTATGIVALY